MEIYEIITWVLIVFLVALSGIFAGSETVLVSSDRYKLRELVKKGDKRAEGVIKMLDKPDRFLSITLVGTNFSVVSVGVLFKHKLGAFFPVLNHIQLSLLTTLIVAALMLIFSEIVPKTIGLIKSNELVYFSVRFLNIVYVIFFPVILLVRGISRLIDKVLNFNKGKTSMSIFSHKGDLKSFVIKTSLIEDLESRYISNIMNYSKTTAREIMTPLVDVCSIEIESTTEDLLNLMNTSNFSRIPVYRGRVDNIVGYVNTKDLIFEIDEKFIKNFVKEPFFIPETKKTGAILMDMRRRKLPMVMVVDEYGGTAGIITDEDIAEEIVGDILMEKEEETVVEVQGGEELRVNAHADVDDLNEKYGLGITKDGFETLGGFIMYVLGHVPKKGEHFDHKGFSYVVYEADEKSVSKIVVGKIKK